MDVFITFLNNSDKGKEIKINTELAEKYIEELKRLAEKTHINSEINIMEVSKLPEILNITTDKNDEQIIWEELNICLNKALESFIQMRKTEGTKIEEDLKLRIDRIYEKIQEINEISSGLVEEYIVKLKKRINEILKDNVVDETRLAQEVVIYSDKCSVEEEITRLKSHISQFLKLINEDKPIGKKMDFLIQEMNRETNTIGSKSNKLEITNLVVDIKTELEDIREQIQNIE